MSAASRVTTATASGERRRKLDRFGSHVELRVQAAPGRRSQAQARLDRAEALLLEFDQRLSRFDPASELCALNADPRATVPASPMMQRFAEAVGWAGRRSGGLVDATCLPAVERSGYVEHLELRLLDDHAARDRTLVPALGAALHVLAGEEEAAPDPEPGEIGRWREVRAVAGAVTRPAGVRLDSGGIGKGLAADLAAELLRGAPAWMVDCGGDLRIGGTAGMPRPVDVLDPIDRDRVIHRLHVTRGSVATSGVTRRSWERGRARQHHLIDPRTGQPSDTGVLQVTALAPTALEAEVIAKTALLSGAARAHERLEHGGVIVCATGAVILVPPPKLQRAARPGRIRATMRIPGSGPGVLRTVETPR